MNALLFPESVPAAARPAVPFDAGDMKMLRAWMRHARPDLMIRAEYMQRVLALLDAVTAR